MQFPWDREGRLDERSSCWVRVSQAYAGAGWGGVFLPRIGSEVLIRHMDGDPDRPICIGQLYNGQNRTPYKLPEHKTRSTLKTHSTLGGEGYNELRFEDQKGKEQIYIQAEKDQDIRIKHDKRAWVGNERHLLVHNNQYEHVHGDKHKQVDGEHKERIDGKLSIQTGKAAPGLPWPPRHKNILSKTARTRPAASGRTKPGRKSISTPATKWSWKPAAS